MTFVVTLRDVIGLSITALVLILLGLGYLLDWIENRRRR